MLGENPETVRSRDGSRLLLAVFGKHPAWSDHLEDIGLDTPSLAEFKRWLYVEGIRSNLDSGAWERLEDTHRLSEWNHRILMIGTTGMIVARLWATSDARGRRAYPMVAATHLPTTQLPADLRPLFDSLESVREACMSSETQDEVRAAVRNGTGLLEKAIQSLSPLAPEGPSREDRLRFLDSTEMGPSRLGFERLIHVMISELKPFSKAESKRKSEVPRSRSFRVPIPMDCFGNAALFWRIFFQPHVAPDVVWTAVQPMAERWADLLVGEPDVEQVFRFRAGLPEIPAISGVPFNLSPETLDLAHRVLAEFSQPPYRVTGLFDPEQNGSGVGFIGNLMGKIFGKD
jgi:hypothetical protein